MGVCAQLLRILDRHGCVQRQIEPRRELIFAVLVVQGQGIVIEQFTDAKNDIVDVALRAAIDDDHKVIVAHAEKLNLPSAFQRTEHAGDDFDADRRPVWRQQLRQMQVGDLAAFRIAPHTVERIDQQRLLITFPALVHFVRTRTTTARRGSLAPAGSLFIL